VKEGERGALIMYFEDLGVKSRNASAAGHATSWSINFRVWRRLITCRGR